MPSPSHHIQLPLYADDTAVIATSRRPALLIKYLETYLSALERWLSKWKTAINVSKSSALLFVKNGRRIPQPRPLRFFGEPIEWVDTAHYLGVTLDKRLTWSKHRSGEKQSGPETGNTGSSPKQEKQRLHQEWRAAVQAAYSFNDGLYMYCLGIRRSLSYPETASTAVKMSSHCYQFPIVHW
jgi:hypothetical protein